ncbi:MAG: response regulator [Bacteroidales bacterium]|nr:response regulator [Bacteroidales bacterium]
MSTLSLPNWSSKTVLIVEDLPHNYELLSTMLIPTGIAIAWAKNGLEAIEYIANPVNKADIVLMDINMPVLKRLHCNQKDKGNAAQPSHYHPNSLCLRRGTGKKLQGWYRLIYP